MSKKDCPFCKIVSGDVPVRKLVEGRHTIAILDATPATLGHTLIITKKHHDDITTMSLEEMSEVAEQQLMLIPAIGAVTACSAFNLIGNSGALAGQVVMHAHFHIIPRYEEDGLVMEFPKADIGDEEKDELAELIRDHI